VATIKPILDAVEGTQGYLDAVERSVRDLQPITESALRFTSLEIRPKQGTVYGDLSTIFRFRSSAEEKVEPAERLIKGVLRNPIAPQRFQWIRGRVMQELQSRATLHGTSIEEELKRSKMANLLLVIKVIGPYGEKGSFKAVRRALNEEITRDLLGDKWRRKLERLDDIATDDQFGEFEALRTLDGLIRAANLSQEESKLLISTYHGQSLEEIAKELGITAGAARTKLHRARKKIKRIQKKL
jgi:RNA polymerase sigma factor (sigma-70 family)